MRRAAVASLALLAVAAGQQPTDPAMTAIYAAQDRLMQGHYLAAVRGFETVAFDAHGRPIDGDGFGAWQQYAPMLTERRVAIAAAPTHLSDADRASLRGVSTTDAMAAIRRGAQATSIVVLNEAHSDPQGRAFGLAVARALRPLGYRTLAVETFTNAADDAQAAAMMASVEADGYVRHRTGVYLNDPAFGDFLRQALALGYRPVAYEQAGEPTGIEDREQAQAEFAARRAVPKRPGDGKLLVFAGYGHAMKAPANGRLLFAARLKAMTGVDPLTIDQTTLAADPAGGADEEAYRIVAADLAGRPGILMKDGRPFVWHRPAGTFDLQVVRPTLPDVAGRPGWLVGMGRQPSPIPAALLPTHGTRLVQAFLANEAADAIPVDQVLVTAGRPVPALMLPPGRPVRYAVEDDTGTTPLYAARQ